MPPRNTRTAPTQPPPKLPLELVFIILEGAQYNDLVLQYKWLKNYSLVCRSWRAYAQQLLFTHVALLKGAGQCTAFKNSIALADAHNPEHAKLLRESVRTLGMSMDHQEIYADVLAMCPNIRELQATLYHGCFRPEVLKRLARAPRVQALRIKAHHPMPLFQFMGVFQSVQYLEVDCNNLQDTFDFPSSPSWRLRELRYSSFHRSAHLFLSWALSGRGRETLEILRVQCSQFELPMLVTLGVAARLRSLSVQWLRETDDLSSFKNLRELAVIYPQTTPLSFKTLPDGVVHVDLAQMRNDIATAVALGLADYQDRTHGSLQFLTYQRRGSPFDPMTDAEVLYNFCAARNIEFRLLDPEYGRYAGERVPLEPSQTFPRNAPFSGRRPKLDPSALPWRVRREPSFMRRIASVAGRALTNTTVPAVALARP
ncbi:hypothetical protein C8Q74DRAFT_280551 [Fomes fomentarius]|nr:hypothetical protein C8Q74DRAFT_280551 [Fomes fomentarius]